jgi:hypothetical protein
MCYSLSSHTPQHPGPSWCGCMLWDPLEHLNILPRYSHYSLSYPTLYSQCSSDTRETIDLPFRVAVSVLNSLLRSQTTLMHLYLQIAFSRINWILHLPYCFIHSWAISARSPLLHRLRNCPAVSNCTRHTILCHSYHLRKLWNSVAFSWIPGCMFPLILPR